jgi:hypothetical protein
MENLSFLHEQYNSLIKLPHSIREEICRECSWSMPTFYRKVKALENFQPAISKAEAEKILSIFRNVYRDLLSKTEPHEK